MGILYHTCPLARAKSILRNGTLPSCSKGAREESGLHTAGRRAWAAAHVSQRHGAAQVVSLRVSVPRGWLKRRGHGLWSCGRLIPPGVIQAINIAALF